MSPKGPLPGGNAVSRFVSGEPESGAVADSGMDTVYDKDNKIQMDVKMPEELDGIAAWIPYAQEFVSSIQPVAVYEYISE